MRSGSMISVTPSRTARHGVRFGALLSVALKGSVSRKLSSLNRYEIVQQRMECATLKHTHAPSPRQAGPLLCFLLRRPRHRSRHWWELSMAALTVLAGTGHWFSLLSLLPSFMVTNTSSRKVACRSTRARLHTLCMLRAQAKADSFIGMLRRDHTTLKGSKNRRGAAGAGQLS